MGKRSKSRKQERAGSVKSDRKDSGKAVAIALQKRRASADPMPQIIARIPQQGTTRDSWDTNITTQLDALWLERMPQADREIASAQEPLWPARMSSEALRVLDEIIIRQAGTLGWRIGLSERVHWRLGEWQRVPTGLGLLKRHHRAIERATRIFQRREKPPLDDPGLYRFKLETVKELRVLLSEMRDTYKSPRYDPPGDLEVVVVAHFLKGLATRRDSLPFLAQNCTLWEAFFKEEPTVLRVHLAQIRLRPAELFNSWLSWCKGVDSEWLRQTISRQGSSRRGPSRNVKL